METVPVPEALELRLENEWKAEAVRRRAIDIGAWVVSLSTFAILLVLIVPMGRTSPWLLTLSLYGAATRLATYLSWKAYLFPRFLLQLDDGDAAVAGAARAVLERNRLAIVRPILVDLLRPRDDAAVAAIGYDELAALARHHDVDSRRRLLGGVLAAWVVVSVVVWGTVIATGAGPTN